MAPETTPLVQAALQVASPTEEENTMLFCRILLDAIVGK